MNIDLLPQASITILRTEYNSTVYAIAVTNGDIMYQRTFHPGKVEEIQKLNDRREELLNYKAALSAEIQRRMT